MCIRDSKSSYRRSGLAPRCRLIASWGCSRSQGLGCSPIKAVRELGSERRETVRSLSGCPLDGSHGIARRSGVVRDRGADARSSLRQLIEFIISSSVCQELFSFCFQVSFKTRLLITRNNSSLFYQNFLFMSSSFLFF